jgi:uncharacterized membrane protein
MALRDAAVGGSEWSWRELARRVPYVLASVGALLLVSVAMPLSDDWLLLGMALLAVGGFLWVLFTRSATVKIAGEKTEHHTTHSTTILQ